MQYDRLRDQRIDNAKLAACASSLSTPYGSVNQHLDDEHGDKAREEHQRVPRRL